MRSSMIRTAIVCSLVAALAACGNGTTGGNGDGGSTGNGNESTGAGIPGLIVVTCNEPSDKKCTNRGDDTQSGADSLKQDCMSGGGTVVDHCPTDGLQGCCLIAGLGDCFYDAMDAASAQSACGSGWTTTPP